MNILNKPDAPNDTPLIVIVGQTASGKSAAAMEIALACNGEIICADSRTVYQGMDIGTAKPSVVDQALVPHHVLDVVAPNQLYNVALFQQAAQSAIDAIRKRGKLPIVVGGTGLYVDALVYDYSLTTPADQHQRAVLSTKSVPELQQLVRDKGLPMPSNDQNPRHLIRTIERNGQAPTKSILLPQTYLFGMSISAEHSTERIHHRTQTMIEAGLENEARSLAQRYGWEAPGMLSIGYREWQLFERGERTRAEVIELIQSSTRQYAKRQRTWFKRNDCIQWHDDRSKIVATVTTLLNK